MLEKLGKYEIRGELGRGAMGVVYDGWDPGLARRVAIKTAIIPDAADPETQEQLARFQREAQAVGRLTHPNIVGVFDYGEANGSAYIVMEFIDGPTLKSMLDKQERFPVTEIVRIMQDVLAGMQFSHERGVVHRDIKPANVMMTSDRQAKIADFGIARIESSSMTQAGTIMGTPAYMSPEQFMGQVVDARSDIYSAGVMLYQMLTGERPFEGGLSAIMHKALNTEPPAPSQISVTVPRSMDAVVRQAMAKRPDERFPTATAFSQALGAALRGDAQPAAANDDPTIIAVKPRQPAEAPKPAPVSQPAAPAKKSPVPMIAGIAAVVLALGGGGAFFLLGSDKPAPAPTVIATPATPPAVIAPPPVVQVPAVQTPPPSGPSAPTTAPAPRPIETPPPPPPPVQAQAPKPGTVPTAPPTPSPPPRPTAEMARDQIARLVSAQPCALIDGDVRADGNATMSGIAGTAEAETIRMGVAGLPLPGAVDWTIVGASQVFCPVLDAIRVAGPRFGASGPRLALNLADGRLLLFAGDPIKPKLTMPSFPAYLRLDYIAHDGTVQHLYPQVADKKEGYVADPIVALKADETVVLGDPKPGHPAWIADEPFGTDMIVAIASSRPLFDKVRPGNVESASDYLRDLKAAIENLRGRGDRLVANAIMVDVQPK